MIPYTEESQQLFQEGAAALAEVESNGIRIDTVYLDKAIRKMTRKIKYLQEDIMKSEVIKEWKKLYKSKFSIGSNDQLGKVLFDKMGFPCPATTPTGKPKTDEATLATVDHPFVKDLLKIRKFQKALSTYLIGLKREVVDGFVHPFFNLHTTLTFRSSSDSINFQNIPVRDPEMAKRIRSAFIARPGRQIIETDYGGIEVKTAACYHKDPNMISYIEDETKDMHRDMAMECFKLEQKQITKALRHCGKNMFVFPQFYGDWYVNCARDLWNEITSMELRTADDISVVKHLFHKSIKELGLLNPKEKPRKGTFERHIQKVENHFWNERFPVYGQWKKEWYDEYKNKGWFESLTGFIYQGYMTRNEVINYPIQGDAFHCLLWSLIELRKELKKQKMKTLIVGQIHDSIVSDVPKEETDDYINMTQEIMVERLMKEWDWIIVPLNIDTEASPVDGNWAQKAEMTMRNGIWMPKEDRAA